MGVISLIKVSELQMFNSRVKIQRNPCRTTPQGFTLVELMVVIAIVVVLMILSVPVIGRTMDSAKRGECSSNLRQIGNGLMMYAADNCGKFPMASDSSKTYQDALWGAAIWTYVGYSLPSFSYPDNDLQGSAGIDKNIFHCPITKHYPKSKFKDICTPATAPVANRFSYAINSTPSVVYYGDGNVAMPMGVVKSPAATALVLESHEAVATMWTYHFWTGLIPHQGGSNVLYFDGHVDWLVYRDVPPCKGFDEPDLSPFWSGK